MTASRATRSPEVPGAPPPPWSSCRCRNSLQPERPADLEKARLAWLQDEQRRQLQARLNCDLARSRPCRVGRAAPPTPKTPSRAAARAGSIRRACAGRSVDLTRRRGAEPRGRRALERSSNSMAGKVEERRKRKQAEAEAAARKRTAEAPIDLVEARRRRGWRETPGQAAAAKRPAVPASSPLFSPRPLREEPRPRRRRGGCAGAARRDEARREAAGRGKVNEVEEQVRAAAWRQTQAHQAEMAQRDAAHQARLEAALAGGAAGAGVSLVVGAGVGLFLDPGPRRRPPPRRPQPTTRMRTPDAVRESGCGSTSELLREATSSGCTAQARRTRSARRRRRRTAASSAQLRITHCIGAQRGSEARLPLCPRALSLGHTGRAND